MAFIKSGTGGKRGAAVDLGGRKLMERGINDAFSVSRLAGKLY